MLIERDFSTLLVWRYTCYPVQWKKLGVNTVRVKRISGQPIFWKNMNIETREKGLIKKCLLIDLVFGDTERKEKAQSVILRQHNFITAIEY